MATHSWQDIVGASSSTPVALALRKGRRGRSPRSPPALPVAAGEALPRGTDAVLSAHEVEASSASVRISKPRATGYQVEQLGSEVTKGEKLLGKGTLLRAQDVSRLASV